PSCPPLFPYTTLFRSRRPRSPARLPGPTRQRGRAGSFLRGARSARCSFSSGCEVADQPLVERDRLDAEHRLDGVRGGGAAFDQLQMLVEGSGTPANAIESVFGIQPVPLDQGLIRYLAPTRTRTSYATRPPSVCFLSALLQ